MTEKNLKNCPFCGEEILIIAIKCKHCQSFLENDDSLAPTEQAERINTGTKSMQPGDQKKSLHSQVTPPPPPANLTARKNQQSSAPPLPKPDQTKSKAPEAAVNDTVTLPPPVPTYLSRTTKEAMPIGKALVSPFTGTGLVKWLAGSILSVIPFLFFLADGYQYRLIQNGISANIVMPRWNKPIELFTKGILLFLIKIIYLLIPLSLGYLLLIVVNTPNIAPNIIYTFLLATTLAFVFSGFILPMAWTNFAASGRFPDAFKMKDILARIKRIFVEYFTVILILFVLWLIVLFLTQIPLVGWGIAILGSFYNLIVSSLLVGVIYRFSHT